MAKVGLHDLLATMDSGARFARPEGQWIGVKRQINPFYKLFL